MAKKSVLKKAKLVTVNAETALIAASKAKAKEFGYNFSEYVSRLLVADLRRKNSAACNSTRVFRSAA